MNLEADFYFQPAFTDNTKLSKSSDQNSTFYQKLTQADFTSTFPR